MTLDPIDYAVISQSLQAAGREMGVKLIRSAYSTILREARDGSAALLDRDGNVIAQAELIPMQLGPIGATIRPCLERHPADTLEEGDFFAMVRTGAAPQPGRFHVIAVDIDHSTEAWLNAANGDLYTEAGLASLRAWLHPGGVFGLWSDAAPDAAFLARMAGVFARAETEVVTFANPLRDAEETCTIYRGWAA